MSKPKITIYGYHGSTNSRPVLHMLEDQGISYEFKNIDLMKGETYTPDYLKLNPNAAVPVMVEHGKKDFVLTESEAILRYLANNFAPNTYPDDLHQRARVDEAISFCRSHLYVHLGYNLFYPQVFGQ